MNNSQGTVQPLMQIKNLTKTFLLKQSIVDIVFKAPKRIVKAVDNVSLDIHERECVGLVGESGCGKSTLAATIMRLHTPDSGKILFDDKDLAELRGADLRRERTRFQLIFQDPYSSLNPRMSVKEMLAEALRIHKICPREERNRYIDDLLEKVGMSKSAADRFPGEFSGGQRQRLGIARALAVNPAFIIADEPVSALDASIQAQVINLLIELQQSLNLTILFISHDLRVVRHITNKVAVMYLGKIVEFGASEALFKKSYHPYTEVLIKAAPGLDPRVKSDESAIEGEPPSPIDIPPGCRFHPRCSYAQEKCREVEPEIEEIKPGRSVSCHFPLL